MNMQKLFGLIFLLVSILNINAIHAAGPQIGVPASDSEYEGAITYIDNSSGSITIGGTRYQLTNETIIHYSSHEDAAVGYGKFKLSKDMILGFEVESSSSNKESNRISEVWVLQ